MFKHYLIVALRNLWKSKLFTLINVAGLAIGMAACVLIFVYLQHELSFDRFHEKGDRILRVLTIDRAVGVSSQDVAITMPPFGPEAAMAFPEIESYCRISFAGRQSFEVEPSKLAYANPVCSSDSTFFTFFTFPLIKGDPTQVLVKPFSMVVTEKAARRMFGSTDVVGRIVKGASGNEFTVTGVAADPPENSHLQFEIVTSFSSLVVQAKRQQPPDSKRPIWLESWQLLAMPTYICLKPGASWHTLLPKLTPFLRSKGVAANFEGNLQPLFDTHLRSTHIIFDTSSNKGDAAATYTLAAVAMLILLIASVNFMNLSTARASLRAREVGLRKVVGSTQQQLRTQFLGESIVLSAISMVLALSIAELFLPWLNQLTGYHLKLNLFTNPVLAAGVVTLVAAVGLLAGSYPAAVLSRFQPVEVLKGAFHHSRRGRFLRRGLVVFQFALSIVLICGTIMVNRQLHFIQTADLGYNREQVLILDVNNRRLLNTAEALRNEISSSPHVSNTAVSDVVPGRQCSRATVKLEGDPETQNRIWSLYNVDFDALKTLQLTLLKGRGFSRDFPADTAKSLLINEAAAREMGPGDPVGKQINLGDGDSTKLTVVGVVKDFHFASLREKIEPLILSCTVTQLPVLTVRIKAGAVPQAMAHIEKAWKKVNPALPFEYRFLDDEFHDVYQGDINFGRIGNAFSGLAIFIACLGLFGLASHTTDQRRKEIGIRKVLGASVMSISGLLIVDYIRWVALANLVAWPLAYYAINRWLGTFVYHTELTWLPFALSGAAALVIAVLTVLGHALKAATSNPVHALRYE
jgi:putative ABC transport system permease protein